MPGEQRELTFRFLAEPTDVNFGGKVHGGMVMKWIDQTGYAAAAAWAGSYCVTAGVDGIQFVKPILIGDQVSVRARLAHTGRSSMHFVVDVMARNIKTGEQHLATSCIIIFVALDAPDGRPTAVPNWQPQTDAERRDNHLVLEVAKLSAAMHALTER